MNWTILILVILIHNVTSSIICGERCVCDNKVMVNKLRYNYVTGMGLPIEQTFQLIYPRWFDPSAYNIYRPPVHQAADMFEFCIRFCGVAFHTCYDNQLDGMKIHVNLESGWFELMMYLHFIIRQLLYCKCEEGVRMERTGVFDYQLFNGHHRIRIHSLGSSNSITIYWDNTLAIIGTQLQIGSENKIVLNLNDCSTVCGCGCLCRSYNNTNPQNVRSYWPQQDVYVLTRNNNTLLVFNRDHDKYYSFNNENETVVSGNSSLLIRREETLNNTELLFHNNCVRNTTIVYLSDHCRVVESKINSSCCLRNSVVELVSMETRQVYMENQSHICLINMSVCNQTSCSPRQLMETVSSCVQIKTSMFLLIFLFLTLI